MTFTPKKQPQNPTMSGRGAASAIAGEAKSRALGNVRKTRIIVAKKGFDRKVVTVAQGFPGRKK